MKLLKPVVTALAAGLLLAAAPAARAQQDPMSPESVTEQTTLNNQAISHSQTTNRLLGESVRRNGGRVAARPGGKAAPLTGKSALVYIPTAALRQQTVAAYVAQVRATDPAAAQVMQANLGPGKVEYQTLYDNLSRPVGLTDYNVADILATYLLENWRIVNNVPASRAITKPMARGVQAQAAARLRRQTLSPDAVGQLGEQLKLQAALLHLNWQQARRRGTDAAFRQQTAAAFQRQYQFDLRQRQLTAAGLVAR